jgi:tetratricopeptide (TPR) repeat protein
MQVCLMRLLPLHCVSFCTAVLVAASGAVAQSSRPARADSIVPIAAAIREADYRDDRAALRRLYLALDPYAPDSVLGARVRYWRGFALWRRVINGLNDQADTNEIELDARQSVTEFENALASDPGFADASVGASSCLMILAYGLPGRNSIVQRRAWGAKAALLLQQAATTAPDNPRVAWVRGGALWYAPPAKGGGQEAAIAAYDKALETAHRASPARADPLAPAWGEPEVLMSLAWSNAHRNTPDFAAAEADVQRALALVPYWHYARDILLAQIRQARDSAQHNRS